jgi:ADP-ribose pyrophosphatase
MNSVYSVAFKGKEFMMVYNDTTRKGWEMPGGRIEYGETPEEAAEREFLEESGYAVKVIAKEQMNGCWVCCCELLEERGKGEMETAMFSELPKELSFPLSEYEGVIEWARKTIGRD